MAGAELRLFLAVASSLLAAGHLMPIAAQEADQEGIRLDFQEVELGIVISALADAAGLNVSYTDLPQKRVTLRINRPIPENQILPLLRSVATANGLRVEEDGPIIRLIPLSGAAEAQSEEPPAQEEDEVRLFVYRLKHARAPHLAATLQATFTPGGRAAPYRATGRRPLSEQLREQRLRPMEDMEPAPEVTVELGEPEVGGLPAAVTGSVLIVPDEATNSLLVRASTRDWEILQQAIELLDLRPFQVLIEALIVEVRRTSDLSVGITGEFATDAGAEKDIEIEGSLEGFTAGDFALQVMRLNGLDVTALLSALSRRNNVRIISRPVLVAQNNQEAHILIGEERPFVQVFRSLPTDAGVRDQVVQFRDVGTSLTIVPTINEDGYVNLLVIQEVSTATAEEQFGAPVISTREAATQLFVRDGQTVVIGGLIDHQEQRTRSGVPLLRDIPLLGWIFGSTQRTTSQNELFIFLTPHIIATDDDAERLRGEMGGRTRLMREDFPKGEHGDQADSVPPSSAPSNP